VRFVCTAGDSRRLFLTTCAAAEEVGPVLKSVGPRKFKATEFGGLEALASADRAAFFTSFGVSSRDASQFEARHAAPPPPELHRAKRQKKVRAELGWELHTCSSLRISLLVFNHLGMQKDGLLLLSPAASEMHAACLCAVMDASYQ
jgi:hypothetical protein